jgi:serine/threonine-protein kinase
MQARGGRLPYEQAFDIVREAAKGVEALHAVGLVHRDIKPANLFLLHPPLPQNSPGPARRGPDPVVKILDWGLARCVREPNEESPLSGATEEELAAEKGTLVGTADYIAPEQAQDPTLVDIRADLYSLGCVLFYLLTGRPPFLGGSLMQKLVQHQEAPPPSLRTERPEIPEELDALVSKLLAKKPEDRPQIPLLVVTPLRRFCMSLMGSGSANGSGLRPSSSGLLTRPGLAPGTALNLPRPSTHATLSRPATQPSLARPSQNSSTSQSPRR